MGEIIQEILVDGEIEKIQSELDRIFLIERKECHTLIISCLPNFSAITDYVSGYEEAMPDEIVFKASYSIENVEIRSLNCPANIRVSDGRKTAMSQLMISAFLVRRIIVECFSLDLLSLTPLDGASYSVDVLSCSVKELTFSSGVQNLKIVNSEIKRIFAPDEQISKGFSTGQTNNTDKRNEATFFAEGTGFDFVLLSIPFGQIIMHDCLISTFEIDSDQRVTTNLGLSTLKPFQGVSLDSCHLLLGNMRIGVKAVLPGKDEPGSYLRNTDLSEIALKTINTNLVDLRFENVLFTNNLRQWSVRKDWFIGMVASKKRKKKTIVLNFLNQINNYVEVLERHGKKEFVKDLRPLEFEQLRKLSWIDRNYMVYAMLTVNKFSNNYGSNYVLPFLWYVFFSLLAYQLVFNGLLHGYFMADKYFYMLNPAHRFDILMAPYPGKMMDWIWNVRAAPYIDFAHRIVNGYLIFQVIRAFRRYNR